MDILPLPTGRLSGLAPLTAQESAQVHLEAAVDEKPGRQVRWQELTKSECFELLAQEHLGRVALVDDRGPVVFPVNFVLDRHMVVFRTDTGTKLDAACRGRRVAFEIDGTDAADHTGWSVLVRGEAVEVTGEAELTRLRKLPLNPWAPGAKTRYVRVLPAALTGRRILALGGPPDRAGPSPGAARGR
jgi:nitroimidazol reductase NimA-like FMN-containing flavoprotein (pyridoxamine 5'-phosphate oxidase superfamily)